MNNNFVGSHLGRYYLRILLPFLMLITMLAPPKAGAEVYSGRLGGADNVWEQWLPVTIPSDGTFTTQMTVSGDLHGGNSGHCLYDSTKTNSCPYVCGYTSPLGPWGLKAGNYYLKVWTNNQYGRGTYTVTTTFTPQPLANDAEPNDAYAQAGTLSTSGSVTGHLGYWNIVGSQNYKIDSEDWWRLTLPSAGKLNLNYTYDKTLAGATGIYLYAQDGSTLIRNTDSTLAAGTYYLQTWDNSPYAFGGYTITLAFSGATPCTWTASPSAISQAKDAGTGSITLTASATSCTWSASSNQSWLTLATSSGTGSGTLTYSVSANAGTTPRTATITVSGQGVAVTQAAASGSVTTTDLMPLSAWTVYGTASSQGGTLTIGDNVGYDTSDSDRDGNPYNVWYLGSATAGQGFDYDVVVSNQSFSPPLTISMSGCIPTTSYGYHNVLFGRQNTAFTGASNSKQYPITQEFGFTTSWDKPGLNTAVLSASGTLDQLPIFGTSLSSGGYCGDFRIDWANGNLDFYYNGSKVKSQAYAYQGPVRAVVHSFDKPYAITSFRVAPTGPTPPGPTPTTKPHAFHGNVAITASTAKIRMVLVAEEIIAVLAADPNAEVKVTVDIQANFPSGASDQTKRAVTENARTLNFKNADWE